MVEWCQDCGSAHVNSRISYVRRWTLRNLATRKKVIGRKVYIGNLQKSMHSNTKYACLTAMKLLNEWEKMGYTRKACQRQCDDKEHKMFEERADY